MVTTLPCRLNRVSVRAFASKICALFWALAAAVALAVSSFCAWAPHISDTAIGGSAITLHLWRLLWIKRFGG